jgi:DtxR family Mn-dependent transcriptional regulator
LGEARAIEIYDAHKTIKIFLKEILGLPDRLSESEACKMEHGLSRKTLTRLEKFIKMVMNCRKSYDGCSPRFPATLKSKDDRNNK